MNRLSIERIPDTPRDDVVKVDQEEVVKAMQTIDKLFDEYRKAAKPDRPSLAIAKAEADRLYRAGLGSPEMLREMLGEIKTYLQRLTRPDASDEVQGLALIAAKRHLGDGRHQQAIANVLSHVVPYRKGLANSADTAAQVECLRAVSRAAGLVKGPLLRLNTERLASSYSSQLRGFLELEHHDAPAEPQPIGHAVPVTDGFMMGTIRFRRLDRLNAFRDVLAGVEAIVLAEIKHRKGGLAARGRDVQSVARQLRALRDAMVRLDARHLSDLIPSRTGDTSQAPLVAVAGLLSGLAMAARTAADGLRPPMGRPKAADPLVLGVQALADLWHQAKGAAPTITNNRGSFCDMCLVLLGPDGVGFAVSTIKGQVRLAVHAQGRAE
jgi:hypothetical protein